jgi:glutamyl-tRNA synthetase
LDRLAQLAEAFRQIPDWSADALEASLKGVAANAGLKTGEFIHPARVAVSGRTIGPSLYHMLEVLGRDRVLSRLERTIRRFSKEQT